MSHPYRDRYVCAGCSYCDARNAYPFAAEMRVYPSLPIEPWWRAVASLVLG